MRWWCLLLLAVISCRGPEERCKEVTVADAGQCYAGNRCYFLGSDGYWYRSEREMKRGEKTRVCTDL